jgi:hypothetical protein
MTHAMLQQNWSSKKKDDEGEVGKGEEVGVERLHLAFIQRLIAIHFKGSQKGDCEHKCPRLILPAQQSTLLLVTEGTNKHHLRID